MDFINDYKGIFESLLSTCLYLEEHYRYDKYIQIYKNLIYLYYDISHEMPSCFTVSDFAGATFVWYNTPQA